MGMYTEFVMAAEIKAPNEIVELLRYMTGDNPEEPKHVDLSHPLFKTERWKVMLQCNSAYFPGETHSILSAEAYPHYPTRYWLTVRCNLKNYGQEIEKFLDWLKPYIHTDGFLGYLRCEEDKDPILIYRVHDRLLAYALGEEAQIDYRFPDGTRHY